MITHLKDNTRQKLMDKMMFRPVLVSALLLATNLNGFSQGALTPSGPPGPTMKTLDQVEARTPISTLPYTISKSGSYYLTTNLTDKVGTNGIIIAASDVTLDLNGFTLKGGPVPPAPGPGTSPPSASGIVSQYNCNRITIRNGTIAEWAGGDCIDAVSSSHVICERLTVSDSGGHGIRIGDHGIVRDCMVTGCWYIGIYVQSGLVTGCVSSRNEAGIEILNGQVRGCVVNSNTDVGIEASVSTVTDCQVVGNAETGIRVDGHCQIFNNCISGPEGPVFWARGISVYDQASRIENNTIVGYPAGLELFGTHNFIIKNIFSNNTQDMSVETPSQNTAPAPVAPGSNLTNVSPWANLRN